MFVTYDIAEYDPETGELQRFYGEEPEPENVRCSECHADLVYEADECGCGYGFYEPDPDAYAEEYHWRLSSIR